jgi:hypothetical protein
LVQFHIVNIIKLTLNQGDLGWPRDLITRNTNWYALYAKNSEIEDSEFCNKVKHRQFRQHPRSPSKSNEA